MNKKYTLTFLVAFLLCPVFAYLQPENKVVGDVVHPSPDAANLSKYGKVNVAKQTGKLVQSIPLKGVQENAIGISLSLRNVADLKLGSPSSNTGNFSLGIPMISRETRGTPDEVNLGYFINNQNLLDPEGAFNDIDVSEQIRMVSEGTLDAEPDFFSYNITSSGGGSYSGSFYFNRLQEPVFVPQQDLKLEYERKSNGNGGFREFIQFTLVLPNGERWTYGKLASDTVDEGVETMVVNNQTVQTIAPSSWYLRTVSSYDSVDSIYLDYETDYYQYKTLGSCQIQYFSGGGISPSCSGISTGIANTTVNNHQVKGWRVSTIRNSSGTERLDFFYTNNREDIDPYLSTTPKSLDKIEYSTGTYCVAHDFHYSYFLSPGGTDSHYKRLKLDSLQERSCDNTEQIPSWRFDYYAGSLENRFSKQIDSWGYFNAAAVNEGTYGIPNLANETFDTDFAFPPIDTAWRETNEAAMKIGNLKTIYWPDGGSSHFEYEANEVTTSVTGPSTYSAVLPNELSNCGIPVIDNNCCSVTSATVSHTFTTEELDGAVFGIFVFNASCNVGARDYPKVKMFVKKTSSAGYGEFNNYTFDTDFYCASQGGGTCEINNVPLTIFELSTAFVAGVDYTFELILDNEVSPGDEDVKAIFQIFNEVPGNPSLVAREVGGLRVTKITDKDGLSSARDQVRTFDYNNSNGLSSGRLAFEPTYYGYQKDVFDQRVGLTFHSTSVVPTANSTGNHISYSFVEESFNSNGKNASFFNQEFVLESVLDEYPYNPDLARVIDGQEITNNVISENGDTLVQSINTPLISYTYTNPSEDIIYKGIQYQNKDGQTGHYAKKYRIRTAPSGLITKNITTRDGVRIETNTTYDITKHLSPISISTMDDRGIPYTTELSYVFDDLSVFGFDSPIYTTMENENRIVAPIQTIEKNNGVQVRGNRIQYSYFDKTTGSPSGASNSIIYPSAFYDFEMTFNAAGVAQMNGDGWELDGTIGAYDPNIGKAAEFQKIGWQKENYTWNDITKLIEQRKFLGFEWDYTYKTGTRLVETITDKDGQVVTFFYDSLLRLEKISARGGAVETEFSYVYAGAGQTYVERKTTYAADPTGNSALQEVKSRQYFDGLGRAILEVQIGHSEAGKDVVKAIEYDNNGRPYKQFESVESPHSDGRFYQIPTTTPHTLTEYEPSPLNRVEQVTAPDWHPVQNEYGANEVADAVINHSTNGNYAAGTLFKSTAIDGNGNKKVLFTDFRNKVILERVESADGNERSDTYRNYDLREREKSIYPPDADATTPNLIYTKLYDGDDNITEKKVPDAAKMDMVYDARDLLIAQRGGNLRADGKWMVTELDNYGRATKVGLNTTPTTVNEIWLENFWDGANASAFAQDIGFTPNNNLVNSRIEIGKLTGTKTSVLNGNTLTGTTVLQALNYNNNGQLISDLSTNHRGGRIWKYFDYDLADNLVRQKRIFHTTNIAVEKRDTINTTFDHQGRVKNNYHTLIDEDRQHISQLAYTIKDELKTKSLGGTGSGFLQQVNYTYLNNGFLSGINPTMSTDDLFQLVINYDQEIASLSGEAQKNGNITQLRWKVKGGAEQTYGYDYDFKDQLIDAKYGTYTGNTLSVTNNYSSTYSYDARGNIMSITREGMYDNGSSYAKQQIDQLNFTPIAGTNKVQTITDSAPCPDSKVIHKALDNTEMHAVGQTIQADNSVMETASVTYQAGTSITLKSGFHAKAGTTFTAKIDGCPQNGYETDGFVQRSSDNILYDVDGNMITDPNKGITILYNYFNLPYKVSFNNGNKIEWTYDGRGKKLQQQVTRNNDEIPMLTIDYIGSIEYQNDTLDAIYLVDSKMLFDKGIVKNYQYYLRDNINNTRVVFENNGSNITSIINQSHYYAYGGLMKGDWQTDSRAKYLFNGIEKVDNFGLSVYHAKFRTLDQWSGRWWQIDPEVEQFYNLTPYNNNFNNPIQFDDPNGDCPECQEPPNEQEVWANLSRAQFGIFSTVGEGIDKFFIKAKATLSMKSKTSPNIETNASVEIGTNVERFFTNYNLNENGEVNFLESPMNIKTDINIIETKSQMDLDAKVGKVAVKAEAGVKAQGKMGQKDGKASFFAKVSGSVKQSVLKNTASVSAGIFMSTNRSTNKTTNKVGLQLKGSAGKASLSLEIGLKDVEEN